MLGGIVKCLSIVSMLLLSIFDSAATTVVLIRTPEHLIVGADSLVITWQPSSKHGAFYTCKLHQQGAVFFVVEGMGIAHSASNFSAEKLARKAISDSQPPTLVRCHQDLTAG